MGSGILGTFSFFALSLLTSAVVSTLVLWATYAFAAVPLRRFNDTYSETPRDAVHFAIFALALWIGQVASRTSIYLLFTRGYLQEQVDYSDFIQPVRALGTILVWIQFGILVGPWLRRQHYCLSGLKLLRYTGLLALCGLVVVQCVAELVSMAMNRRGSWAIIEQLGVTEWLKLQRFQLIVFFVLILVSKVHLWGMRRTASVRVPHPPAQKKVLPVNSAAGLPLPRLLAAQRSEESPGE